MFNTATASAILSAWLELELGGDPEGTRARENEEAFAEPLMASGGIFGPVDRDAVRSAIKTLRDRREARMGAGAP